MVYYVTSTSHGYRQRFMNSQQNITQKVDHKNSHLVVSQCVCNLSAQRKVHNTSGSSYKLGINYFFSFQNLLKFSKHVVRRILWPLLFIWLYCCRSSSPAKFLQSSSGIYSHRVSAAWRFASQDSTDNSTLHVSDVVAWLGRILIACCKLSISARFRNYFHLLARVWHL